MFSIIIFSYSNYNYYFISDKLELKVPISTVVTDMNKRAKDGNDCKVFVSNKMCHNIIRDYNIPKAGQYNRSDWLSSKMALEICKKKWSVHPHCLFQEIPDRPECGNSSDSIREGFLEDAFIVLMSPYQLSMLKDFGENIVGVDTTHQVSTYNHNLTTIVVQDHRREGVPVAFCISRSKDSATYTRFFEIVKTALGQSLRCEYFISDGDLTIYNSWKQVMGPAGQSRLCLWHVKKAWGRKLDGLKMEQKIRVRIEKELNELIEVLDETM